MAFPIKILILLTIFINYLLAQIVLCCHGFVSYAKGNLISPIKAVSLYQVVHPEYII